MMAIRKKIEKGTALLLAVILQVGLLLTMPYSMTTVQAAEGNPPSVTVFATKEELMNTFRQDGNNTTIGKIIFGKDSNSNPLAWYILGKDGGVSGDNIAIFVTSPIGTSKVFQNESNNNKIFDASFGVYSSNPSEIYPNHYGASDFRVALQELATNTSYFTSSEQLLMQATPVKTTDTMNSTEYTTTDVLYALKGKIDGGSQLWAGSGNDIILSMSTYCSSGNWFWLRSPSASYNTDALAASPGSCAHNAHVSYANELRLASNLNLSSVSFASAATATTSDSVVTGTIPTGTAMILRLDGSNKNIGTAIYYVSTGKITATKGSTTGAVSLVVQGHDGTNNWYYSKKVDGTVDVSATDIKTSLGMSVDVDLLSCKIWLETTDTDGMIYAVDGAEGIQEVAITGIEEPSLNVALDATASCITPGISDTELAVTWTPADTTADYNTSYIASVTLSPAQRYSFADDMTATVNGENATSVTKNSDGTLTVTYAFDATAKDKLTGIMAPQPIIVENGTVYQDMNLPTTITIQTEGNTETTAAVAWDTTTPAEGSYDPSVLTEQRVTLKGTVTCPNTIDANGVLLTTNITIIISAAETPVNYKILEGANASWKISSDVSLSVKGSGDFSKFLGVKVDGTFVDAKNYTAKEGSTVISLKPDYLNTLSVGSHTLEIVWTNGTVNTKFTIIADALNDNKTENDKNTDDKSNDDAGNLPSDTEEEEVEEVEVAESGKKDDVPNTGDDAPIIWRFILLFF